MANNTQQLRELIDKYRMLSYGLMALRNNGVYTQSQFKTELSQETEKLLQLIEAECTRREQALLDELVTAFKEVVGDKEAPSSRYSKVTQLFNKYLTKRYAELTALKEE